MSDADKAMPVHSLPRGERYIRGARSASGGDVCAVLDRGECWEGTDHWAFCSRPHACWDTRLSILTTLNSKDRQGLMVAVVLDVRSTTWIKRRDGVEGDRDSHAMFPRAFHVRFKTRQGTVVGIQGWPGGWEGGRDKLGQGW